ncbi:S-layer homology domain-containing protein [Paenibacillus sp. UNC451MF]|uniref:S-layer homology domain-containing protein n=1 Tax=Paenibacillus sp. UNC451MF TaxID=1449063 RepID=UPI00048A8B5F|nr:S-layer homology domain-containing protein [Paenibacillus sp. UNC451MF]
MFDKQGRSKMSALLVFAMLFSMLMPAMAFGATTVQFKDVADSYAQKEIQSLVDSGIISGYEDGTFQPRKAMTRAELAKIIVLSLGLKENSDKAAAFKDVDKSSWYRGFVGALVESGITQGTSDTTFAPDAKVTREELVVFFVRAMKLEETAKKLTADAKLSDLKEVSSWAQAHVSLAFNVGFVNGLENKDGSLKFAPKDNAERQALARLAYEFKANKDKYVAKANELAASKGVEGPISSVSVVSNVTVEVTFNEEVSAPNKADFTFDNGLTVSAAELKKDSKKIVVLTTSAQTAGTVYKLSYKGKDTGKTITGASASVGGGGGGSSSGRHDNITVGQLLNQGGTYANLTLGQTGTFGPADGTTTTITGTLTINPGENGEVTLKNISAANIEVLSGSDQSVKFSKSKITSLKVNAPNQNKKVRIETLDGTSVVTTSVYSQVILEATAGTLGNVTVGPEAAGKTVALKGNIGNVKVTAPNADIQLLPTLSGGATTVGTLEIGANAKVTTDAKATLNAITITAPKASVELNGAGAVKSVTVSEAAAGATLTVGATSNIQSIEINANITLAGDAAKLSGIELKVAEGVTVSFSDTLKDGLKKAAIEAIATIGQFNEYSVETENLIHTVAIAVNNALNAGVLKTDITNYSDFMAASKLIQDLKAAVNKALDYDKQYLEVYFYNGDSAGAVTSNVWLSTQSSVGNTITWTSSNGDVISIEKGDANGLMGKVTRPAEGQPDAVVTLTATLAQNGLSVTKTFQVIVKALSGEVKEQVAAPTASLPSGEVVVGKEIYLKSTTVDAAVYYTVDSTTPTTASILYTAPITITSNVTIKAIAVKAGMLDSNVSTFSYTVSAPPASVSSVVYSVYSTNLVSVSSGIATVTGTVYGPFNRLAENSFKAPIDAKTDYIIVKFSDVAIGYSFSGVLNAEKVKINGQNVQASVYESVYLVFPTKDLTVTNNVYSITGLEKTLDNQVYTIKPIDLILTQYSSQP